MYSAYYPSTSIETTMGSWRSVSRVALLLGLLTALCHRTRGLEELPQQEWTAAFDPDHRQQQQQQQQARLPMCDTSHEARDEIAKKAVRSLWESGDFEVIEGTLSFNQRQIGNPAGRYGTVTFPRWSQPFALCNATAPNNTTPIPFSFCNIAFTMGPRDAVVWLGCTPPPAAHFSIRSYVAFRFHPSVWFPAAELGDPANQLTLNSTGGPDDPFSKTALMISTGDAETERHVRRAFVSAGLPSSVTNLDVVPADVARFRNRSEPWITDRSDAFAWQFRASQFEDQDEAQEYFAQKWPVYLVRAKRGYNSRRPHPIPEPAARPRGTGRDESYLHQSMKTLEEQVIKAYAAAGSTLSHRFPMDHIVPDVARCLADPHYMPIFQPVPEWHFPGWPSCDWFSADALYSILSNTTDLGALTFPMGRTYVALGVNQPRIGKAMYSNLMLTAVAHFEDPMHSVNLTASELQGSANVFAPEAEHPDDVWAYSFSRDCSSGVQGLGGPSFCREVTTQMINATEFLFVVERKYLEPATKTGPSPNEVMPAVVLVFDRMKWSNAVPALNERAEEEAGQYARPALRRARA